MNTLLIHNNNIANIDSYNENIQFTSIDNTLALLDIKEFDIIYIKDTLSINCLDFIGIELAYHIRFTQKFKHRPIVILSDLDGFTLSKLTTKAQILLTKNTFLNHPPKTFPIFDNHNYKADFLDKISIGKPKDTSGDHDISNQWSISKWAKFLKITNNDIIQKNKDKVSSMLYFKYLVASKTNIYTDQEHKITYPKSKGTILYIDDQWNIGWRDIFKEFFSTSDIEFKTIEEIYKDKSSLEIQSFAKRYITDINPDLVILDLRLHQDDNKKNIKDDELNGIKILKFIKTKLNSGIQVILLTASGKSTILNTANKYNILGYIKKEHPNDTGISTKEKFDILASMVDKGLDRKYLKNIYTNMKKIKKILDNDPFSQYISDNKKYKDYNDKLKLEVSYIYNILDSNTKNKLPYAMISIQNCLETILSIFIAEKKYDNDMYWDGEVSNYNSVKDKMYHFLNKKLGYKDNDTQINELTERRNSYVHPNNNYKDVTKDEITEWFKLLLKIIEIVENPPNYVPYDKNARNGGQKKILCKETSKWIVVDI